MLDFTVSRDGRTLRDVEAGAIVFCSNGKDADASGFGEAVRVRRDGTFSASLKTANNPFATSQELRLEGRFTRSGLTARVKLRGVYVGEGGTRCETTDTPFAARRGGSSRPAGVPLLSPAPG